MSDTTYYYTLLRVLAIVHSVPCTVLLVLIPDVPVLFKYTVQVPDKKRTCRVSTGAATFIPRTVLYCTVTVQYLYYW